MTYVKSPRITSIAVRNLESGQTDSFSIHQIAEEKKLPFVEISNHYDAELEYAMKKLSDAIGPLLTLGLAAVVGFFALAIYLPMWDLTQMVK